MIVKMDGNLNDEKYSITELNRVTTAPPHKPTTITKYIAPRTVGVNVANSYSGSLRNFILSTIGSNVKSSPIATGSGLATVIDNSPASPLSSIQTIGDERAIDEQRELSKITKTLTESIIQCCSLELHNQTLEMRIEWLQGSANKNSMVIDRMFTQEMQSARELIEEALRSKPDLEKKLRDLHQTTLSNDEHYQQLLARRNTANKDLFDYHRKLAQSRAEAEFLQYRIAQLNDEIQFYTMKNESLQIRKVKLRYELDEEIFAQQVLQSEFDVLESEKISNDDVRAAAIDEVRGAIDVEMVHIVQPAAFYREQLIHQVRQSRLEYESKIQTYRDELHRRYELELHRYHMHKTRPVPGVTKEHERKLFQLQREKKTVEQQISSVRGAVREIQGQLGTIEKQMEEGDIESRPSVNAEKRLELLQQRVRDREKQVADTLKIRADLQQKISKYRDEIHRRERRAPLNAPDRQSAIMPAMRKSILRSSSVRDLNLEHELSDGSSPMVTSGKFASLQDINRIGQSSSLDESFIRSQPFDAQQDCRELSTLFNEMRIDEAAVIKILCNRSAVQRIQVRDLYKDLFQKNLINVIETKISGESRKILKLLLLSSIERDCYELRRLLQAIELDENILIELLLTNSNRQIKTILSYYHKLFGKTVESEILATQDTPSTRIFLALLQANRPEESEVDEDEVFEDARHLSDSRSKWQADGSTFIRLLCNRSNAHLKQTFAVYQRFGKVDIEESIRADIKTDLSRTLMGIVQLLRHPPRFFANQLYKSFQGSKVDEDKLTRIILARSEIDLTQIKLEFENIAQRPLLEFIQSHTKGTYQAALLELLRLRIELSRGESPFTLRNRPTVQWKEPLLSHNHAKSSSSRDGYTTRLFDRDNQAKSATLSTIQPKPARVLFSDLKDVLERGSHLAENDE